jgi:hypothetical protein
MSVTLTRETNNFFVISIDGVLSYDELKEIESKGRQDFKLEVDIKLLVLAQNFSGWGKEGDWGDLTFFYEIDSKLDKIAVVTQEKWKDEMLMYLGAGRRQAEVKIFFEDEEEAARSWLQD